MKHARATSSVWSELENVPAPSRGRGLGLRFLPGGRSFLSSTLCFLPRRTEIAESHPCECDALDHRCLGSATVTGGNSLWANANISDSGERQEIRIACCARGNNEWHQSAANAIPNAPSQMLSANVFWAA